MNSYHLHLDIFYENNKQYRQCLRDLFFMKTNVDNDLDIDEETLDENDYDVDASEKAMDYVYEKTKNNDLFKILYECAAHKMFTTNHDIGLAVLFSYDYLKLFHLCLQQYIIYPNTFNEDSECYINMYNAIK